MVVCVCCADAFYFLIGRVVCVVVVYFFEGDEEVFVVYVFKAVKKPKFLVMGSGEVFEDLFEGMEAQLPGREFWRVVI